MDHDAKKSVQADIPRDLFGVEIARRQQRRITMLGFLRASGTPSRDFENPWPLRPRSAGRRTVAKERLPDSFSNTVRR